jgi:hypothetical protein
MKKKNWSLIIICILAAFYAIAGNMPFIYSWGMFEKFYFQSNSGLKAQEKYDGKDGATRYKWQKWWQGWKW